MLSHYQPNIPPPPPPIRPPLFASFNNHSLKNSSFFISSGFVNLVSNCASCRLKANNVGILAIYLLVSTSSPTLPAVQLTLNFTGKSSISVESISTSTYPSPPSRSPTFSSSIIFRISGRIVWQVAHHFALHIVMSVRLSAALSMVSVSRGGVEEGEKAGLGAWGGGLGGFEEGGGEGCEGFGEEEGWEGSDEHFDDVAEIC
ncbi:hypothetical protein HBI25_197780 [Parastagonospora nodorum]|nr:hypothetical protein HBH51_168160 [Parastagonospora nodorum]KAH4185016.1 hypothetical protein HBH42_183150 [Parastagonospora nodorum]KAH4292365.1 hypothetical protein HBI01_181030 [Parastagonospora nodorum]KAH4409313.1 hypothetical protein HBH92_142940 [Parastagonospora nodorum]KAH4437075.1 hypothetical protein HBH91_190940 [Parastagonospora nodorum]